MTEAVLKPRALRELRSSSIVALENLEFYKRLYDDMEVTPERDAIGQAMAQKQSYIGAIEAILNNHEISIPDRPISPAANDSKNVLRDTDTGEHLSQEERFAVAVMACLAEVDDKLTVDLLNHHLKAAEIAVATIKSSSLKI